MCVSPCIFVSGDSWHTTADVSMWTLSGSQRQIHFRWNPRPGNQCGSPMVPLASGISNLASGRLKLVPLWTTTAREQAGGSLSHPKLQECSLASDSTETPRYPRSTRQESILIHHWFPEVTEGHFIRLSALKNSKMVIKIHVWVLGNVVYCRSL